MHRLSGRCGPSPCACPTTAGLDVAQAPAAHRMALCLPRPLHCLVPPLYPASLVFRMLLRIQPDSTLWNDLAYGHCPAPWFGDVGTASRCYVQWTAVAHQGKLPRGPVCAGASWDLPAAARRLGAASALAGRAGRRRLRAAWCVCRGGRGWSAADTRPSQRRPRRWLHGPALQPRAGSAVAATGPLLHYCTAALVQLVRDLVAPHYRAAMSAGLLRAWSRWAGIRRICSACLPTLEHWASYVRWGHTRTRTGLLENLSGRSTFAWCGSTSGSEVLPSVVSGVRFRLV